jgi:hypothetical protein
MSEQPKPDKLDVVDAWDRAQHLMIPRWSFPIFAALFVALCGAMAVILFAVGKIFGGLLFSSVVAVGMYVFYNNLLTWRARRAADRA